MRTKNYDKAVKILEDRFGNTQILISAFIQQFVSLPKIKSANDISGLRKLFDKVENSVRKLKTVSVEPDTYESLLVPLISEELPNDLKLLIARQFDSDVWSLSKMLGYLKKEIEVKERATLTCASYSQIRDHNYEGKYSLSALTTHAGKEKLKKGQRPCIFCNLFDHSPRRCFKISDPKIKRNILKRSGRCFVCFETGHLAQKCSSDYKCHKCQGKHNISICLKNERTNVTVSSDSNTSNLSTISPNSNQTAGPGGNLNNSVTLQTDSTAVNVNSCKNKVFLLQTAKAVM